MNALPGSLPVEPVSIGQATRAVVADCIRKWSEGAALSERERAIMDEALALNRFDMMQAVFAERETADAQR